MEYDPRKRENLAKIKKTPSFLIASPLISEHSTSSSNRLVVTLDLVDNHPFNSDIKVGNIYLNIRTLNELAIPDFSHRLICITYLDLRIAIELKFGIILLLPIFIDWLVKALINT